MFWLHFGYKSIMNETNHAYKITWRSKITWGHKILSFKQCGVVDAPHCFEAWRSKITWGHKILSFK